MSENGQAAENAARAFLRGLGWEIVCCNYRSRWGEIDIVARDGETICFVEVRARQRGALVSPAQSVSRDKRQKLTRAASDWLGQTQADVPCRFDVVEVELHNGLGRITAHIQGAFDVSE
ncbi:MAG: YraN family protein [Armatimonadetes bacterium]|nr:YraN family protein [Armatimonadota bacterium]